VTLTQLKQALQKPGATEEYPFGPTAMVFKICGKMFALVGWQHEPLRISLKCDPDEAQILRQSFAAIEPGYHLSKEHWNTITLEGDVDDQLLRELIDRSYELVVKKLKKADREALGAG